MDLKSLIRNVPDFPKKGIGFKDITTLLKDPDGFREAIRLMGEFLESVEPEAVAGIESRGFVFGAVLACQYALPFVLIRKKGKLPAKTMSMTYSLEYGTDTVEVHADAVKSRQKILIVDDLLATGGTAAASAELFERGGAEVVGVSFLIELAFLEGREKLKGRNVHSLVVYDGE